MAVVFRDSDYVRGYNRSYVKELYAQKQIHETTVVSCIAKDEEVDADTYVVSRPWARSQNYFNNFACDYIEGRITEDEFYSHMEDLYYSFGMYHEDATAEQKQYYFNYITQNVYGGILDYYLGKNADEWSSNASGAQFYYNTDYHYEHLAQVPSFLEGINKLADKLGVDSNDECFNKNIATVNGRMAAMLGCKGGTFASLDEVPPPGMKMTFYTKYEPFEAKIEFDGKEYKASIPFSYDDFVFKFDLYDLFGQFDIPEKYMNFIKTMTIFNAAIAQFYSEKTHSPRAYHVSEEIFSPIKDFDAIKSNAAKAYEANATENLPDYAVW